MSDEVRCIVPTRWPEDIMLFPSNHVVHELADKPPAALYPNLKNGKFGGLGAAKFGVHDGNLESVGLPA